MTNHRNLKNQSRKSKGNILRGLSNIKEIQSKYEKNFRVSFEYLDVTQGEKFKDWEENGILSKMNDTLLAYCKEPMNSKMGSNFKEYGEFPSNSGFEYPRYIEKDVDWAALHITGRNVLGGFISGNTFFVVFLDKSHQFWIVEKKHT